MSPTRVAVDEGIVAAARDVGSIIAKHVETTERNGRLAPPVIDALRAAGLFRLFTPRALGGLEIDPVTAAHVVEEVSTFDSAAGSAFQVNTGAWWTSRMLPEGVAELYADGPDLMMAASFAPPHRAEEVAGLVRGKCRLSLFQPEQPIARAYCARAPEPGDQRRGSGCERNRSTSRAVISA